jgi:hypothetical protein
VWVTCLIPSLAQHTKSGLGCLVDEVFRSLSRPVGLIWTSEQLVAEAANHTHKRRKSMPSKRFEPPDPSNQEAADLLFRPHGHWTHTCLTPLTFKNRASYIQDGRTANLQMLHFMYFFNKYDTSTEYFKHTAHSPFFSSKCRLFHNTAVFGSCIIHILQSVLKFKCKTPVPKG